MNHDRQKAIIEYDKKCPATAYRDPHDWRYATSAPGSYVGDDCARCQRCELPGIRVSSDRSSQKGGA